MDRMHALRRSRMSGCAAPVPTEVSLTAPACHPALSNLYRTFPTNAKGTRGRWPTGSLLCEADPHPVPSFLPRRHLILSLQKMLNTFFFFFFKQKTAYEI